MSNDVIDGKAELVTAVRPVDPKAARLFAKYFKNAVGGIRWMVIAGFQGLEISASLKQGQFGPWLEKHCPDIHRATAYRFMQTARGVAEALDLSHTATNRNCPIWKILSMSAAQAKKLGAPEQGIRDKVFELVDGKSRRQLLLEFKDEPKDRKYHPPKLTDDEKIKAEIRDAELGIGHLIGDIHTFCLEGRALGLVKDSTRNNLMEAGIAMNNRLREFASKKSKSKKS